MAKKEDARLSVQEDLWQWGLKDPARVIAGFALCLAYLTDPVESDLTPRKIKSVLLKVVKRIKKAGGGIPT